ncbi:hypothetical protein GQ43DRAFT_439732 [Delitschia confertaspora ATCC 74209]|uniref:DUF7918 domain-containing protein n=1 Tax=Delitschia confertaspora ATCC 74209 TaxID=1513339 RepID=A0A9P4JMY7_9PLEO|nr:hypothetical protein GQ43DRAFT_439732 [Delitschia confertaspora ATCC 74209]
MPSFRSINLELRSQFDIDTFPEYYPPTPKSEEGGNNCSKGIAALKAVDDDASTCNVYIPAFPGSHFWINYSISPPIPDVTAYFLFKMYIDGTHVVSWSCGKEDNWSGKTVFVLHEKADSSSDKKRIEKRFFCFSTLDKMGGKRKKNAVNGYDSSNFVEITVHRARGRKRIPRQLEQADKPPKQTPGIR